MSRTGRAVSGSVRTRVLRVLALFLMTLILATAASAASIYVAPIGSDTTGNGTIGNPYATLWKASTVAVAGDTVYARGGTYVTRTPQNGANVIVCSGAVGNPITFTNYPGEYPIFDGSGASGWADGDAIFIIANAQHLVFQGFELRNTPYTVKAHGIIVWECDDILIKNCLVHDVGACGINLIGHDLTAEGNEVYRVYMLNEGGTSNGGWGCAIKTEKGESAGYLTPTNSTFRNNYVHEVWGEAVNSLYSDGFLIEGNTVVNSFSVSIYTDNAKNGIVRNNVVYTTPENEHRRNGALPDGILIASERYTGWTEVDNSNIQIYNNVITRQRFGIAFWRAAKSYNNLKIYHNTVGPCESYGFRIDSGGTAPNELKNNIIYGTYYNANPSVWVTSYNCWPNGVPTSGSHPNSFAADPLLINPTLSALPDGWKLAGGSPCINCGASVGVTTDFWGTARDANPDLGFHEYVGGPQPPVAQFSGNPTSGAVPLTVMFTDLSTNSPTSWSWNFGDGSASTAQHPSHQYTSTGQFTVSLRATNAYGYDDEVKANYITVTSGGQAPVAQFTGNPTSGAAPLTVNFTDQSSYGPTSWSWNFGDGGSSTAQNPSHQYTSTGQFTVSLRATNAYGYDDEVKTNYITATGSAQDYFCSSYSVLNGTYVSGDHTSVHASDDQYLVYAATKAYKGVRLDFTFTTGLGSLSSLSFTVEGKVSTGTQPETVYLYNYSTSSWVSHGTSTLTTSDSTLSNSVTNPGNYISGGTVQVRVQVGPTTSGWTWLADLVKITAAP